MVSIVCVSPLPIIAASRKILTYSQKKSFGLDKKWLVNGRNEFVFVSHLCHWIIRGIPGWNLLSQRAIQSSTAEERTLQYAPPHVGGCHTYYAAIFLSYSPAIVRAQLRAFFGRRLV